MKLGLFGKNNKENDYFNIASDKKIKEIEKEIIDKLDDSNFEMVFSLRDEIINKLSVVHKERLMECLKLGIKIGMELKSNNEKTEQ